MKYDVAVVGGGFAGLATAAQLQAAGRATVVFEAHGQPGGCAGYFRRRGFSFDVGATTLVDFEPGGVGGQLLARIGMDPVRGEALPGYLAWLPDRRVTLYRDFPKWKRERERTLGDSPSHLRFWRLIDRLADVFWEASRRGVKLPVRSLAEALRVLRCVRPWNLPLARYRNWTMGTALRWFGLRGDRGLVGILGMLIEDTVHSTVDDAPLINAALGVTIRGAGLTRAAGGMRGFLQELVHRYRSLGGTLLVAAKVKRITGRCPEFTIETRRGAFGARQVVSAVPIQLTSRLAPPEVQAALQPYLASNERSLGGAVVVFLGVPEAEVSGQPFTHHQLLQDYAAPLGDGNNMFISVSAPGDQLSAPAGYRAVMISTHCELDVWEGLSCGEYEVRKQAAGHRLVQLARRVYPTLGDQPLVYEVATPRTYQRFTQRPRGAVGGFRLNLKNANQAAVPHHFRTRGFWQVGDTTWPGLGTVASVLGSRIVAEGMLQESKW